MCYSAVCFHGSAFLPTTIRRWEYEHGHSEKQGSRGHQRGIAPITAWNVWALFCMLASSPSALYTAVKAVPGFLTMSAQIEWFADHSVALVTMLVTMCCLPPVAQALCESANLQVAERGDLLILGKLLALPSIPFLVTCIFDVDCLGAWVFFWPPCVEAEAVNLGAITH
eukprot:3228060-Amphidinium_carterae.1